MHEIWLLVISSPIGTLGDELLVATGCQCVFGCFLFIGFMHVFWGRSAALNFPVFKISVNLIYKTFSAHWTLYWSNLTWKLIFLFEQSLLHVVVLHGFAFQPVGN